MLSRSIIPAAQGIESGIFLTFAKRSENSVKAGANDSLVAFYQIIQASRVFELANRVPFTVSKQLKITFIWFPAIVAMAKNSRYVPDNMKPSLAFVTKHLGTLYQVLSIASSIFFLSSGQVAFAFPLGCLIILGFLDRNGALPLLFRQSWHKFSEPAFIATSLVFGGAWGKTISAIQLLLWVMNQYQQKTPLQTFTLQQNLTLEKAKDCLQGKYKVQIHKDYIYYQSQSPPKGDIDIQRILTHYNQIKWEKNIDVLRRKLAQDARFTEEHGDSSSKTDGEIIAIMRDRLQQFMDSVKNKNILSGEPTDYEILHNYLKIIANYLDEHMQNDEITCTDYLFKLAVEGGVHCGPGKVEAAEEIAKAIKTQGKEIPVGEKVMFCLETAREHWFQTLYQNDPLFTFFGKVLGGKEDLHNYNLFVNLFGPALGIHKASAAFDETSRGHPISNRLAFFLGKWTIQPIFWIDYDPTEHVKILSNAIGTLQFVKDDFYTFWRDWINRQEIEDFEKEALIEMLSEHQTLLNSSIEDGEGKINSNFIILMLIDLGVLEIEKRD